MILKCVYFLSVYIISEIMLFLSLRRRRTIKKKLKTWDLQRQHLTFLLVEVQKNLDIDFIVCTVTCKYWFWYWCSSEKANSAQIMKDCNSLPLPTFSRHLEALENTISWRKEVIQHLCILLLPCSCTQWFLIQKKTRLVRHEVLFIQKLPGDLE